jgi:hypothetical protein
MPQSPLKKPRRAPAKKSARANGMAAPPQRAEHWLRDAGAADVATLDIPASMQIKRVFNIDVRFVVRAAAEPAGAWHALTIELNGVNEWTRRIATHCLGQTDSLDYHCRRELGVGQALRIRAVTQVGGALRQRLVIEAEEVRE